jgi:hypothetical protein
MVSIKKGTPSLSYRIMAAPSRSLLALRICSTVFTATAAQAANVPLPTFLFYISVFVEHDPTCRSWGASIATPLTRTIWYISINILPMSYTIL